MIGPRKTYQDVARELSEGLASGEILLEAPETRREIGVLTALLFQYLNPIRLDYALVTSAGMRAGPPHLKVEVRPDDYEQLPEDVKAQFLQQTQELRDRGVEVEINDIEGRPVLSGRTTEISIN